MPKSVRLPGGVEPRPGDGFLEGRAAPAGRHLDPATIARGLGSAVHWPDAPRVRERSWRLIARSRAFDAWLIAWPCGATADLHDHGGSRGALHLVRGSLVEITPRRDDDGKVTLVRREVQSGATLAFDAGHVHDVRNETPVHALSLHVYSPPLTSMIYYDRFGDRLIPRQDRWVSSQGEALHTDQSLRLAVP